MWPIQRGSAPRSLLLILSVSPTFCLCVPHNNWAHVVYTNEQKHAPIFLYITKTKSLSNQKELYFLLSYMRKASESESDVFAKSQVQGIIFGWGVNWYTYNMNANTNRNIGVSHYENGHSITVKINRKQERNACIASIIMVTTAFCLHAPLAGCSTTWLNKRVESTCPVLIL